MSTKKNNPALTKPVAPAMKPKPKLSPKEKLEKLLNRSPALVEYATEYVRVRVQFRNAVGAILVGVLGPALYNSRDFCKDGEPIDWLDWLDNPYFAQIYQRITGRSLYDFNDMQFLLSHTSEDLLIQHVLACFFVTATLCMIKVDFGGYECQILLHVAIHWGFDPEDDDDEYSLAMVWNNPRIGEFIEAEIGPERAERMGQIIQDYEHKRKNLIYWPKFERHMPPNPKLKLLCENLYVYETGEDGAE
jgi:hypothetical protein